MSNKSTKKQKPRPPKNMTDRPSAAAPQAHVAGLWPLAAGTVFLALSAAASLSLVSEHIFGLALPGCGPGSPCEQVANGAWGTVPLVRWPVSFLGAAYFLAALVGWIAARGALPTALRYVVRLGMLGSLMFCSVLIVDRLFCSYCVATHVGNFAFWIAMERTRARSSRTGMVFVSSVVMFVLATIGLGVWDSAQRARVAAKAEENRAESVQQMIERSHEPAPPTSTSTKPAPASQPSTTQAVPPATTTQKAPATEPSAATGQSKEPPPFTGRYRRGPEEAAIRIVIITDFQCPDCRQIEAQVSDVLKEYQSVSVSMKHFPFCSDCNPSAKSNLHPNACWAAYAAEAAGILYGNDAFWKLHDWLFEKRGVFTTSMEIQDALQSFGCNPQGFVEMMSGPEVKERVRTDVQEATDLGLYFTPMIFINGVELKGWNAPNALKRTVAEVAATNPPKRTAAYDRPPLALQKYVEDWKYEPVRDLGTDTRTWRLGPEDAKIKIVMWGDYQESGTAEADGIIRAFVAGHSDASYTYRHYPFNSDCNANLPFRRHPLACWAARAAEAAGSLAGNDGYWKMHTWLMKNSDAALRAAAGELNVSVDALRDALYTMSEKDRQDATAKLRVDAGAVLNTMQRNADETLRAAAGEMGLDPEALMAAMKLSDAQTAIAEDIDAAKKLPSLRHGTPPGLHGIPSIFINGKYIQRWRLGERQVLDVILNAAAAE